MNLKQLEVFLAVAESGSFSKGAEASFITQSTVSQHISALEAEFGLRLLDRTGKGALLTEGGKLLLERAKRLVESAREIPAALARFKGMEDVELKIAGSGIPGEYIIPAVLPLLIGRFPGLCVTVLQGDSRDVLQKLASGEVEIGVVGGLFSEEGIEFTPVTEDEVVLIAPPGHPFRAREEIEVADLNAEPFVMRETGSGTGKAFLEALREAGIDPGGLRVAARLGSNEAVKHAVIHGVGVSFVSTKSVERDVAQGTLIQVPVRGVKVRRQFFLVHRRGRDLSPAAAAFREVMEESLFSCR